ncbi:hypothetical protein Hanom_Chr06g00478801 [Helianthus anomalus]
MRIVRVFPKRVLVEKLFTKIGDLKTIYQNGLFICFLVKKNKKGRSFLSASLSRNSRSKSEDSIFRVWFCWSSTITSLILVGHSLFCSTV